jgi:drug/metabolite transporter (DMT)-like permease
MKVWLPIVFATIAAVGNALFALGQKKSASAENGMLFVAVSAFIAVSLACLTAPLLGNFDLGGTVKLHWKNALIGGAGLFLTYLGFNLLYTRFGASQYVLYAVISIITTTVIIGVFWLHEPLNFPQKLAVLMAIASVILFSMGQGRG